ncbi:MAG: hypothetical protein ACLUSL_01520 [Ruminococcus sp.]
MEVKKCGYSWLDFDVHSAEIAVREALAFSMEQAKAFLTALVQESGVSGAVLLATTLQSDRIIHHCGIGHFSGGAAACGKIRNGGARNSCCWRRWRQRSI